MRPVAVRIAVIALFAGLTGGCPPAGPDCADRDGDLYCAIAEGGTDCDDADADVHPGAMEVCADGRDQDCDGQTDDRDLDGDGHLDPACGGDDCDDLARTVSPSASEVCGDGIDQDCSGVADDKDEDGDGHIDQACGGDDCDDADPWVNPSRGERCDGKDDDCDGVLPADEEDADGDGALACDTDCDDGDASVHPGATEGDDGVDRDCDGVICRGLRGRGLATCLLTWLARYDDPAGCEVDLRPIEAAQPILDAAVGAALDLGTSDDPPADEESCLAGAEAVGAALLATEQPGLLEPVCIEGLDGEHLLVLREDGGASVGGFVVLRIAGWQPRDLGAGLRQDVVLGVPQRDQLVAPACGDADLHTFYIGLREMVEGRVPRAFLANDFPRGALNPTGTGDEGDLFDALPGLLEQRGVPSDQWPNRGLLAANEAGVYYALANPLEPTSTRDAVLLVDPGGTSARPHCVFGHPDYRGPDGQACDVADQGAPYLDDVQALAASDGWLLAVDAGTEPTLFGLLLDTAGRADLLSLQVSLSRTSEGWPICAPASAAVTWTASGEGALFLLDDGGATGCGDGGAKLVRVPVDLPAGTADPPDALAFALQGSTALAADSEGNVVLARRRDGQAGAAQDLLLWPLASQGEPAAGTLVLGDDCRLADSRFGVDHRIEDVVALSFTPGGVLFAAEQVGNEIFGLLAERDEDGAMVGVTRLAETDLSDEDGAPVLRGFVARDDAEGWLLVDEAGTGRADLVEVALFARGDALQPGNREEQGRLSAFHALLEAIARRVPVLHLQLHGYDEDDPTNAPLEIPGSQPDPYQWAALLSPGLPWDTPTPSMTAVVLAFQEAFSPSGTELVFPYPTCVPFDTLGARSNRQGQLINYGEHQAGLDGLALHYDAPGSDPPGDEFIHVEWPLALRAEFYDDGSQASAYLHAAIEALVAPVEGDVACPFTPPTDLPPLPGDCSLP